MEIEFDPDFIKTYRCIDDEKIHENRNNTITRTFSRPESLFLYEIFYEDKTFSGSEPHLPASAIKIRYSDLSSGRERTIKRLIPVKRVFPDNTTNTFNLFSAIAEWGLLLKDSLHKGTASYSNVINIIQKITGENEETETIELLKLMKISKHLHQTLNN